jgi:multiple antibiotic resistance protein
MTMTADLDNSHSTKMAYKAAVVLFITIIVFAFSSQVLFNFFGISVHSFRVVGGVILFLMGMDMLQARLGKLKMKDSEIKIHVDDISVIL